MSDEKLASLQVRRPARTRTDSRGRTVWTDPVETVELELVSTMALKRILVANDDESRKSIEKAARDSDQGVLARNPATGLFKIIDDEDLQAILNADDKTPSISELTEEPVVASTDADEQAAESLELVNTQILRKMLGETSKDAAPAADPSGAFDPYNHS